jgi:hypothetical protein
MIGKPNHLGQIERSNRKVLLVIQLKIKKRPPSQPSRSSRDPLFPAKRGEGWGEG